MPTSWHGNRDVYLPPDLNSATHVYFRHDGHRPPLTRPYDGPFHVVRRLDKHFTLDINGKLTEITVDRLKPAKLARDHDTLISDSPGAPSLLPSSFSPPPPRPLSPNLHHSTLGTVLVPLSCLRKIELGLNPRPRPRQVASFAGQHTLLIISQTGRGVL